MEKSFDIIDNPDMKRIEIIEPVPAFVCPIRYITMEALDTGEITELPEADADLLIRKGRAIERRV